MKRQINYILMQTVLWGGWICEYIWFMKHQFQMRFDLWVLLRTSFYFICVWSGNLEIIITGAMRFIWNCGEG